MKTWHEIRRFPFAVRLLLVNQLGVNTGFYLLVPYLATHLTDHLGLSAAVVGVVLGVRNLSQQGLFIVGGSAADRLGARGVIIAGCALRTVGFGLFALGDSLAVLLAASVLSGLAGALSQTERPHGHVVTDAMLVTLIAAAVGSAILVAFPQAMFPNSGINGLDRLLALIVIAVASIRGSVG